MINVARFFYVRVIRPVFGVLWLLMETTEALGSEDYLLFQVF